MKIGEIRHLKKESSVQINDEPIRLETEIVFQYRLFDGMDLDRKTYDAMMEDHVRLSAFKRSLERLKSPQSELQIKTWLTSKGFPQDVIHQTIKKLKDRKYVDDVIFARDHVLRRQSQDGPEKIREDLMRFGIDSETIRRSMSNIDELSILKTRIPSKIQSMKNKTRKQIIASVKAYFILKGFSLEAVESVLMKSMSSYVSNETALLKKTYEKLLFQYEHRLQGDELKQRIMQKLYQKGFKMEDIRNIMHTDPDA